MTQPMPAIEADYLHIHRDLDVARTVAVTPAINVDLDAFGRVYGVERIGGPVDTETLTAVLRELPQLNLCAKGCKLVAEADEAAAAYIERFNEGGWIPSGPAQVTLDDAECVVLPADVLAGTPRCRRTDAAHLAAAHTTEARP